MPWASAPKESAAGSTFVDPLDAESRAGAHDEHEPRQVEAVVRQTGCAEHHEHCGR